MSASWPGSMRGPRVKTPLLLLLLLLLNALTGTVLCQDEDVAPGTAGDPDTAADPEEAGDPEEADDPEEAGDQEEGIEAAVTQPSDPLPTGDQTSSDPTLIETNHTDGVNAAPEMNSGTGEPSTDGGGEGQEGLSTIIILIPVVLVVVIIGMIMCGIFINRRWNSKAKSQELNKEDPYLDGSSTEKVPMPMFEEDVPSVLELEMEELDQWMKKDYETTEDSKLA
ncbi:transmembrane protein 154 [Acanthopagrus latus]|uniref:transmembrane protein 154 n=1 Tax=Acanthopagrus latus TaxID=8177 RepID=UPI00187D0500|nr:transmembrane protein 154 [Acanthopagrus latus]XP_036968786.1 transmembrane protein 154 [Acanthopagrus latus]XP_036968794.1 transmembrane protein 154 [Acanthopagrus latus]